MSNVKTLKSANDLQSRPTREQAEEAVGVLLRWVGENPDREGLRATPGRVVRVWE